MDQITVIIKGFNNNDDIMELCIDKEMAEMSGDKEKYVLTEIKFALIANNEDSLDSLKKFFEMIL